MKAGESVKIVGAGLAGCCLAWRLGEQGVDFVWCDDERSPSASRVAAGLVNPVTGRNFEPSWRVAEFLPEAVGFFREVERMTGRKFWHPLPVHRLVSEKDWKKVARKLERPEVAEWVERVDEDGEAWRAVVVLKGGGRLDVRAFCEESRRRFGVGPAGVGNGRVVRCEGAAGLMGGVLGEHRCAKGEILTVRIPGADESRVLVGGGGWLVPLGGGLFRAGSTYDWERLDGEPTETGRQAVEAILERLEVGGFEVVGHEAGLRPIVRRSMPLIGPLADGTVVFNGLGSKGSLYAPGVSRRLAEWICEGREIEPELDAARFLREGS